MILVSRALSVLLLAGFAASCAGSGSGSGAGGGGSGGTAGGAGGASGGGGGSTGGVGGAPDAASGGSGPAPGSIIVQDNFDTTTAGGPPDPTKWMAYPTGQTSLAPVIDTARFHSAPNAARVTSSSSGLGSFLVPVSGFPVTGNAFYVRVYINWAKDTSTISGHSGFIVGSAARDESGTEVRLGLSSKFDGTHPMMDLNVINATDSGGEADRYSNGFTSGGNPADFPASGYQFMANQWYCLEAFFNGAPSASEFRVWIDGTEVQAMHVTNLAASGPARTSWAPTYNFIKIGANDYDANLGQIWYDDVVVATSPIGCN